MKIVMSVRKSALPRVDFVYIMINELCFHKLAWT